MKSIAMAAIMAALTGCGVPIRCPAESETYLWGPSGVVVYQNYRCPDDAK
jgi:hypothetical protein